MLPPLPRSFLEFLILVVPYPFVSLWATLRGYPRRLKGYLALVGVVSALYYASLTWGYVAPPAPTSLNTVLGAGCLAIVAWLGWAYVQYRRAGSGQDNCEAAEITASL